VCPMNSVQPTPGQSSCKCTKQGEGWLEDDQKCGERAGRVRRCRGSGAVLCCACLWALVISGVSGVTC
jgi:hypothetical protein